jgi:hypothetical protein
MTLNDLVTYYILAHACSVGQEGRRLDDVATDPYTSRQQPEIQIDPTLCCKKLKRCYTRKWRRIKGHPFARAAGKEEVSG